MVTYTADTPRRSARKNPKAVNDNQPHQLHEPGNTMLTYTADTPRRSARKNPMTTPNDKNKITMPVKKKSQLLTDDAVDYSSSTSSEKEGSVCEQYSCSGDDSVKDNSNGNTHDPDEDPLESEMEDSEDRKESEMEDNRLSEQNHSKIDILASSSYEDDEVESMNKDTLLEIEKQSAQIDLELKAEQDEAEHELQDTISHHTSIYHLPTSKELLEEEHQVITPATRRDRIESILEVLSDFGNRRESHRSRVDYLEVFTNDVSDLFGYIPELISHFLSMFGPNETYTMVQANEETRPLTIRANTLKARRRDVARDLIKRGVSLDPLSWTKVGLKIIESKIPIGATPEYLSGHYMIQGAASLCPVLALNLSLKDHVLDMCAAPGGKTTYMAQIMRNTGTIIANDSKKQRQRATVGNIHRLGVKNTITACFDGRTLGTLWKNTFDKVLLDAPCSGLGIIIRDPSIKVQCTVLDIQKHSTLQKALLLSAIDAVKTNGIVVYSTCSVSVTENEEVIHYALGKRHVKILDTELEFGKSGFTRYKNKTFHPSMALARRMYPHVHNMDGFFVAKLKKISDTLPGYSDDMKEEDVGKTEESKKGVPPITNEKKKHARNDMKHNKKSIYKDKAHRKHEKDWKKRKLPVPPVNSKDKEEKHKGTTNETKKDVPPSAMATKRKKKKSDHSSHDMKKKA